MRAEDCDLSEIASVPLKTSNIGHVGVPVVVAGQEFSLLIDTNATYSTLSSKMIRRLGLSKKSFPDERMINVGSGLVVAKYVKVDAMEIGAMRLKDHEFGAIQSELYIPGFDGVLGLDVLLIHDVEFDFANNTLRIISENHCPGHVVYWTDDGFAVVPLKPPSFLALNVQGALDDKPLGVFVDTGVTKSSMNLEYVEQLLGFNEMSAELAPAEERRTFTYPFKKLAFELLEMRNPQILLLSQKKKSSDPDVPLWNTNLTLGLDLLRKLHLYIATKEQMLYLTPPALI